MKEDKTKQEFSLMEEKIYSSEFDEFCVKAIISQNTELEKKRKKLLWILCISTLLLIVIGVLILIFYPYHVMCASLSIIASIFPSIIIIKYYKKEIRKKIFPKLFLFFGDFKVQRNVCPEVLMNYLKRLEITPIFNRFCDDDYIVGVYNDVMLNIAEIHLLLKSGSGKSSSTVTTFKGLFIKFKSLKKFSSSTIIKRDAIKLFNRKKRVNLEDPEFEKYYDVYSSDQIEARYLLTTAFMNRLVKLNKQGIGRKITLSFEKDNVNIFVSSYKDWFDLPLYKSLNNVELYRNVLKDLASVVSIIDAMKFDQNIGM